MQLLGKFWLIGPLIQHRELLFRFTRRFIERQLKGSWLGFLWLWVNPLLQLALYAVVFGMIMGGDFGVSANAGPYDYTLGIFIGLAVLGMITETMGVSPTLILGNDNLVKKVVFPLEILPVAMVNSIAVRTGVSCFMALGFIATLGPGLSPAAFWFPVILLPVYLLCMGTAWLLSAMGVFFRDSQHFMAFLATALFYASAVFYPAAAIPAPIFAFLQYNPILIAVELSRDVLLWNIPIALPQLAFLYAVAFAVLLLGFLAFSLLRKGFADVI